jgi:hypothetical protein
VLQVLILRWLQQLELRELLGKIHFNVFAMTKGPKRSVRVQEVVGAIDVAPARVRVDDPLIEHIRGQR